MKKEWKRSMKMVGRGSLMKATSAAQVGGELGDGEVGLEAHRGGVLEGKDVVALEVDEDVGASGAARTNS